MNNHKYMGLFPMVGFEIIIFLIGVTFALSTIYGVYLNCSHVPFWDQWDGNVNFMIAVKNGDLGTWFSQHNEHRIFFSRLLFWLDYTFWGGLNKFLLAMNIFIQLITLTLFLSILFVFNKNRKISFIVVGVGLGLLFSWVQFENWIWGFQSQFFAVYTFALLSFFSIVYHIELNSQKRVMLSWLLFGISILSATLSSFTMSNGLLVFPLLLTLSLILKISIYKSMAISAAGLMTWLLYFNNYTSPINHASPLESIFSYPLQVIIYSFAYLGAPAAYIGSSSTKLYLSILTGLVIFMCLLYFVFDMMRRKQHSPIILIFFFFILLIFGTAILTAAGRINFGIETALSSRYCTPALLVWFSVFIIWYVKIVDFEGERGCLLKILSIVIIFSLVPYQYNAITPDHLRMFNREIALLALSMDVGDEEYIKYVYPDLERVANITKHAREKEIGVFNLDWYKRVQGSGNEYLDIQKNDIICKGNIDSVEYIFNDRALRIKGWVLENSNNQVPKQLIITTPDGKVIGYGASGEPRPDVSSVYEEAPENTGWLAYVNYFDWERAFIFAVSENGLCKIPGEVKLGEVQTAIKSLSLSDEFIRISNNTPIKIIKNDWLEDAFPVEIDKNEIISDMQILSSWVNSDESIVVLSFEFVIEERQLYLPYITGPVSNNQKINIFERVNGEYILIFEGVLPASVHVWSYMIIDLEIDQGSVIRVDLVDDGDKWGEWSAVAIPSQ